jgi:hypothetical protein
MQVRASYVLDEWRSPAVWDHLWTTRAPIEREDLALVGVREHGVEAVAELPIVALEQAAVDVEDERDRGVAGAGGDLLGRGAGGDPQRHRGVAEPWTFNPSRPAATVAGRHTRLRNTVTRSGPPSGAGNTGAVAAASV